MIDSLILWLVRRSKFRARVHNHGDDITSFLRFQPFWYDEHHYTNTRTGELTRAHRPPWWRPFNILLHHWIRVHEEEYHNHPRWSITICLKGSLTEKTFHGDRVLRPGSIVFRSHKSIHAFKLEPEHSRKTWTLFIVGRRNHKQTAMNVVG